MIPANLPPLPPKAGPPGPAGPGRPKSAASLEFGERLLAPVSENTGATDRGRGPGA